MLRHLLPLVLMTSLGCDDTPSGATRDSGPRSRDAAPTMVDAAPMTADAGPMHADAAALDAAAAGDATAVDATPSDATAADSGVLGACGGGRCRGDQVCVADACVFRGCVGAAVPGDYATIQSAITALQSVGGTICVAEGTFNEALTFREANGLILQGVSGDATRVRSLTGSATSNGLIIRGVGTSERSELSYGTITLEDSLLRASLTCRAGAGVTLTLTIRRTFLRGAGVPALSIGSSAGGAVRALVDGVDISGTYGLSFDPSTGNQGQGGGTLTVQNSYIHDSSVGVYSDVETGPLVLLGNTIVQNGTGLQISAGGQQPRLTWVGNIVSGSTIGASLDTPRILDSHNALFGNVTNYAGTARDGPGYVKTDCGLVSGVGPPSLAPGSPCRGAGDAASQPPHDYWGITRPSPPSIGAVEP